LAHHLLHRNSKVNYFLEDESNLFNKWILRQHEKEAEVFAAYLLIPEEKLNEILNQEWVKESPNPISALAEEFQVSESFMKKRLKFRGIRRFIGIGE